MFSLQDDDEQWMSLRYDLTAPLARYFAQHFDRLPKPFRSYRAGYVFRNEKPGPGRFRQFMQFDADTVGAAGPEADAEMCMMMADTMDALGLAGKYVVKVNNRKVLDGVLEAAGVVDADARSSTVLRAIDKLDKFGTEGVELLLGEGRKDESGDFTKGAGCSTQIEPILSVDRVECIETSTWHRRAANRRLRPDRRQSQRRLHGDSTSSMRMASCSTPRATAPTASDRPLRRPRPRILHRPRLRDRTDVPGAQRKGPAGGVRLGRRRWPL